MTTRGIGLAVLCIVAGGCVVSPLNGADIGDYDDSITFQGFIFGEGEKACVYVSDESTGQFDFLASDTSSSSETNGYGIDGYYYITSDGIPEAYWACNLPLDGTAESFVKLQETSDASCDATSNSNQDTVPYTYDVGLNLLTCYNNNSNWADFWDDCPISSDAPIVRVTSDKPGDPRSTTGCTPLTPAMCDDGNDCTTDGVSTNKDECENPPLTNGTSCGSADAGTCADGVCLCAEATTNKPNCAPGESTCQISPMGDEWSDCAGNPYCPTCWKKDDCYANFSAGDASSGACSTIPPAQRVFFNPNPGILCDTNGPALCEPRNGAP